MSEAAEPTWIIVRDGIPATMSLPAGIDVTLTPGTVHPGALDLITDVIDRELVGTEPASPVVAAAHVDDPAPGPRRLLDEYRAEFAWEHRRADGTVAVRTPAGSLGGRTEVLDSAGRVVMAGHGLGDLWRWWLEQIAPGTGTVAIISTSPRISTELSRLGGRFVVIHAWAPEPTGPAPTMTSPLSPDVAMLARGIDRLDALVAPEVLIDTLKARFGDVDQWHTAHDDAPFWSDVVAAALARRDHRPRIDGVRHRFEKKSVVVTVLGEGDLDDVRVAWESFAVDATVTTDRTLGVERDGRDFTVSVDRSGIEPAEVQRLAVTWRTAVWTAQITPPQSTWTTLKRVFSWSSGPSIGELRAQRRALKEADRAERDQAERDQAGDASVESSSSSDAGS